MKKIVTFLTFSFLVISISAAEVKRMLAPENAPIHKLRNAQAFNLIKEALERKFLRDGKILSTRDVEYIIRQEGMGREWSDCEPKILDSRFDGTCSNLACAYVITKVPYETLESTHVWAIILTKFNIINNVDVGSYVISYTYRSLFNEMKKLYPKKYDYSEKSYQHNPFVLQYLQGSVLFPSEPEILFN